MAPFGASFVVLLLTDGMVVPGSGFTEKDRSNIAR